MLKSFSNTRLDQINKKLIYLYLLNVIDIVFTKYLIATEYFVEANPIMLKVLSLPAGSLLLKVLLPAILLAFMAYRMRSASPKQLYISNILITILLSIYLIINCSHILWCLML